MLGGIVMILAIATFIMVHEAGHFFAARATGMKATEFFLGFGPKIWSTKPGETEFGVKAIPLGGYVRIIGMNPLEEVEPDDVGRTYREQVFWKKSVVVLSGVALNFVMAYLLLFFAVWLYGLPGDVTTTIEELSLTLEDGSATPAALSDVQVGDTITAVYGIRVNDWETARSLIAAHPNETIPITVDRDGERVVLSVALASVTREIEGVESTVGFFGVVPELTIIDVGFFESLGVAATEEVEFVKLSFQALGNLLKPSSLVELGGVLLGNTDVSDENRVTSPIGLVQIGSQAAEIGIPNLLLIMASVNIILAIFNGLPLYPLDGGHFAVALYEKISGREANVRRLIPLAAAVIILMLFLGVVAITLDIVNPIDLSRS